MSISSSALLAELNISVWPASKTDKVITDQINAQANASAGASQLKKHLFAGTSLRKDIDNFASTVRLFHNKYTMPWADKGARLLPVKMFFDYKQTMNAYETQFNAMCQQFFDSYDNLIAEAPLHLGALYDREDYPPIDEVRAKFAFRRNITPLPESGDFRLDIPAEDMNDLRQQYEAQYETKQNEAMRALWDRLYDVLDSMSKKLDDEGAGEDTKKKRYHDSLITNATELCALLTRMNITNDPKLEEARRLLEVTMIGVDIGDIKESASVRHDVKTRVDSIIKRFDW